jgi:hypothetical protein
MVGLLAATASTNSLTLVTRNGRDVAGLVFNPFNGRRRSLVEPT